MLVTNILCICICDALRDLVPFVRFKKREKYPWRSVTSTKVVSSSRQVSVFFGHCHEISVDEIISHQQKFHGSDQRKH